MFLTLCNAGTFVAEKSQNKTLVLVDTWATLETHSIFFDHIRNMGAKNHTLEFKLITGLPGDKVEYQKFNKYFYDNIILMAPTVKSFGDDLSIKDLLEFVDFHHNLMIFLNNESRQISRELAEEFGVSFDEYGMTLQGGVPPLFTAQNAFSTENVAWSANMFEPATRVFTKPKRPILVEDGVGALLDTKENNPHVFPILRGDIGTYTRQTQGEKVGLVAGN